MCYSDITSISVTVKLDCVRAVCNDFAVRKKKKLVISEMPFKQNTSKVHVQATQQLTVNFTWHIVPEAVKISAILLADRLGCDQYCSPWNRVSAFCSKLLE